LEGACFSILLVTPTHSNRRNEWGAQTQTDEPSHAKEIVGDDEGSMGGTEQG
jgi:hypothetical protein